MPSYFKENKRRAGIAFVFAAAVCIGAYYYIQPSRDGEAPPFGLRETEVVKQDAKIKITHETDIVQRIMYLKCKEEEVFSTKPADDLIGLDQQQIQKLYPDWQIQKFDTIEVNMLLTVDSLCREHANNLFIGIQDGNVAIFYGKPGMKAILKEITKVPVTKLMPQDLVELKRGMSVQSREELLRFIEGLESR